MIQEIKNESGDKSEERFTLDALRENFLSAPIDVVEERRVELLGSYEIIP